MKRIYFVRHGMTEGNEADFYQKMETPLSDKGRAQANLLAERFTEIPFDTLIASTMERAQETARIIGEKTGHKVIPSPLFHEILRPSVVRGGMRDDPKVKEIMRVVKSYWNTEGKRHSDEENFHDLRKRGREALEFLLSQKEERLVVVTHGTILRMMLAIMMKKDSDSDFLDMLRDFLFFENTGITVIEYDNVYHPNCWQLMTWNDQAHLG